MHAPVGTERSLQLYRCSSMPLICASRELNPWVLAIIDGPCEPKWMHAVLFLIKQELRTLHKPLASDYPGKTTSISTKVSLQMLALVTFPARCLFYCGGYASDTTVVSVCEARNPTYCSRILYEHARITSPAPSCINCSKL